MAEQTTTSYRDDSMQELTQDEYQRRFINYYDPVRIQADVAPAAGEKETETTPPITQGSILNPVSGEDGRTILDFNFETASPTSYVVNYNNRQSAYSEKATEDRSGSFSEFFDIKDPQTKATAALGTGLGMITGFGPVGGAGLQVMAQLNRKQHYENAQAIEAQGGGSFFTLDGQTISRAPGSRNYVGTTGNYTQSQIAGIDAIQNGFLPGSMITDVEIGPAGQGKGNDGHAAAHTNRGYSLDAFGTNYSYAGANQLGANASQQLRESEFNKLVQNAKSQGLTIRNEFVNGSTTDMVSFKQQLDAIMKGKHAPSTGLVFRSIRMDKDLHNELAKQRSIEGIRLLTGGADEDDTPTTDALPAMTGEGSLRPPVTKIDLLESPEKSDEGAGQDNNPNRESGAAQDNNPNKPSGPASGGYSGSDRPEESDRYGGDRGFRFKEGGRVGLQEGGVAAAPAGFVERPPSQVSEAATVADDKPMSVPEGTFVINAAAVEFAGEKDIMAMLNAAYKEAEKKGIQPPSEEMLEVAVSRGEVIVPAFLAKIIGYDRLEKINNRGKKETNERIKENGQRPTGAFEGGRLEEQGFVNRKKKEIDPEILNYEDKIIRDEVSRKMNLLMDEVAAQNFEDKGNPITVLSEYFKSGSAEKDYYDEIGRVNQMTAPRGRFFANPSQKVINIPRTPTLLNLFIMAEEIAHLDAERDRNPATRKNPYKPKPALRLEDLFDREALEKMKEEQDKTPVMGADFDPYEAFELESRYLEELRAKQIAFDTVLGMLPKDKKAARMAKASYERMFGDYIEATASPVIKAAYLKKYPELKNFPRLTAVSEEFKKANHAKRLAEAQALTRGMPDLSRISPDVISRIIERMQEEQAEKTEENKGRMIQLRKKGAGSRRLKKRK